VEKGGEWLGLMTRPHTKEVWMEKITRLCSKALISFGRTHCKGKLPLNVFLEMNDNPYGLVFSLSFL
jgi:hypothetical protein